MTVLTIPNEPAEVEYTVGASSSGPFTIPFSFFDDDDIRVSTEDSAGVLTEFVNITDFNVVGTVVDGGFDGGTLTMIVAQANVTLKVYRSLVIDRNTNYPSTGPFNIDLLNTELNKHIGIMQELDGQKDSYISLPDSALSSTPYDADGRGVCNIEERGGDACAATNRQVDANGPNWLEDNDNQTAVGTEDQWNTLASQSAIVIEGGVVGAVKTFDLLTQFYTTVQNRGGAEASFYIRYRYQVDCYSMITKIGNSSYPIKIGASSAIPFSFMDIAEDIDYSNGNCTLFVAIDIFPVGTSSSSLYAEWVNFAVNTSEPR